MDVEKNKILEELKDYTSEDIYREYFLNRYQDSSYENTIRILLESGIVPIHLLKVEPITYLLKKYEWAKVIIFENIDTVISSFDYNKLSAILELSMGDKELFMKLCQKIFSSEDIAKRVLLIDILLDYGFPASESLIIKPLYRVSSEKDSDKKKMEKNSILDILEYRLDDSDVRQVLLNYHEELFESSIHEKMQILSSVLTYFPHVESPLIEKYGLLLSYFQQIPSENTKWADEIISTIIDDNQEELLTKLRNRFRHDELILTDSGSYSIVLGTEEWILKICKERITWDCNRESFLFVPNEFRKILNKDGVPIAGIEWQPYLPIIDKAVTKELIYKYLIELRNQALTIADSSALRYNNKNFRFLKNTKHLEGLGITLPDWFIENPVVSIDIDAIYNRGENKEADQEMDRAISNFKKIKI